MTASVAAQAVAQAAAFAAVAWALADFLMGRLKTSFGAPERWLLRFGGGVLFGVIMMVLHLVTGGLAFSHPAIVPAAAVVVLVAAAAFRRSDGDGRRRFALPWTTTRRADPMDRRRAVTLAVAAAILFGVYVIPAVIGGSSVRTGDAAWHLGWTSQLLAGEPVPVGPAPEVDHNGYPWGYHALLATLTRLVPGSDPLVAHEALHLMLVAALPLAAACLARRVDPSAGWASAGAAALIGGFGWILARGPDFVASPAEARYGADLMVASPNSAYELFPPAFPREVGLVLAAAAALLVVMALVPDPRARGMDRAGGAVAEISTRLGLVAGLMIGAAGLVSVPMLVTACVWAVPAVLVCGGRSRVRLAAALIAPAVVLFASWAAPVAVDYAAFGGFVDVSPKLGVEWPLSTALGSWGLLLPLAIVGAIFVGRSRVPARGALLWFGAAAVTLLGLSVARGAFGWDLGGNETVLHQGRVWPPLHLVGAAFGGIGAIALYDRLNRRLRRSAVIAIAAGVGVVASLSLVSSAAGLTGIIHGAREGFVYGHPDQDEGSFVRRAARRLGSDDVLLVDGADRLTADTLAFRVFEFSGVRLARYDNPRLANNDLRIRFRDLAAAYDRRIAAGGFESNFVIVEVPVRDPVLGTTEREILERGEWQGLEWALIAR